MIFFQVHCFSAQGKSLIHFSCIMIFITITKGPKGWKWPGPFGFPRQPENIIRDILIYILE